MYRKLLSFSFIAVALTLGIIWYIEIAFPMDVRSYLRIGFYQQFGHIAIAVELLIAGIHLWLNHEKTNFTMALFGFTAVLDPILNYSGVLSSSVPVYGTIIFLCFAVISFWIAFTNAFDSGKISITSVATTFILGIAIELFFNYL